MATRNVSETQSRFVGREKELKAMGQLIRQAAGGSGKFIMVTGEAGIGKTRLITEAAGLAAADGFVFLTGRCLSIELTEPYQPFMEALAGRLGAARGEEDRDIPLGLMGIEDSNSKGHHSGNVPLGLIPIAEEDQISDIDIQSEKDRLFDSVLHGLQREAGSNPVFMFIDDLQWADNGTLQLLLYIARNIGESRILLCAAFRSGEVGQDGKPLPFYEHFGQALRGVGHSQIALDRMSDSEISEMISDILNIDNVPAQFSKRLYEESAGNPFFVEEVLMSLMDEGIILRHGHIWDAGMDLAKIRIPNTIKEVISHRIARLGEDEKKILRHAAVAGDIFSFIILREVLGMPEEQLLDSLDKLMAADIIQEVPNTVDEEYRFDHKLIRSVVYESMSQSRVRLMHKAMGEVIERLYPDKLEDWAFDLARHFNLGKQSQKTYDYSLMAADKAFKALAFDRAVEYYIIALRTLDFLPASDSFDKDAAVVRISLLVGNLYYGLGLWNDSAKYYEDALRAARKASNGPVELRALIALAHSKRSQGNHDASEKDYQKAAELAEKLQDLQSMCEIHRGLGYVHWRRGENNDAIEHYNQAISFAMKAGNMSSMAKTFIELGNVYNNWGQYERAIEYYDKSIVELEKLEDYSEMARAYNNIGDTCLHMNEWGRAIEALERCREAAEKIGNRNMVAWAMFNSAEALANIGELDKAERYCNSALQICESQDDKIGMNGVFRCLGIIHRMRKQWDRAIENINKSIVILEMLDIPFDLATTYYQLGLTYREMGEIDAAIENFEIAANYYKSVGAINQAKESEEIVKSLRERKG